MKPMSNSVKLFIYLFPSVQHYPVRMLRMSSSSICIRVVGNSNLDVQMVSQSLFTLHPHLFHIYFYGPIGSWAFDLQKYENLLLAYNLIKDGVMKPNGMNYFEILQHVCMYNLCTTGKSKMRKMTKSGFYDELTNWKLGIGPEMLRNDNSKAPFESLKYIISVCCFKQSAIKMNKFFIELFGLLACIMMVR